MFCFIDRWERKGVEMDLSGINRKYLESKELPGGKVIRTEDFTRLASTPIPNLLIVGLAVILGVVAYGLILLHRNPEAFRIWIREDGLAEWLTFVVLMMMSAYSFVISIYFNQCSETRAAKRVWLFLGFLLLFGAMEEISWGQRILDIKSPDWFLKHNRQAETNIHNLVIYGENLNKLVFGKILSILVAIYFLFVPLLYRLNERPKGFVDRWRIPVAQNYQILLYIIVAFVIRLHLGLSKKANELLELSGCYIMFLVLTHPFNQEIIPLRGLAVWMQRVFLRERKEA